MFADPCVFGLGPSVMDLCELQPEDEAEEAGSSQQEAQPAKHDDAGSKYRDEL